MANREATLQRTVQCAFTVLAAATLGWLAWGLVTPAFTFDELGSDPASYSVVHGGWNLLVTGNLGLGLLILGFSAVFPIAKLLGITAVIWSARPTRVRGRVLRNLELLGKWSMLDVFVVATMIGAAQLGILSSVSADPGIYRFMEAVLASIALTFAVSGWLGHSIRPRYALESRGTRVLMSLLSLAALGLFLASLALPLMVVRKWFFWDRDFALSSAVPRLVAEGETGIAVVFALFVILLPGVRLVLLGLARLQPGAAWLVRCNYHLQRWSMLDVYLLALGVFVLRVGAFADVELRSGFWLLCAATGLTALDGWLYLRRVTFDSDAADRDTALREQREIAPDSGRPAHDGQIRFLAQRERKDIAATARDRTPHS